jgi:hypothetical protein
VKSFPSNSCFLAALTFTDATVPQPAVLRAFRNFVCVAAGIVYFMLPAVASQTEQRGSDLDATRRYYLDQLIRMPRYSPGKNSHLIQDLHRGEKRTVLDIKGTGSVRHIWSTWSIPGDDSDIPAPGSVRLTVFVDGETRPSISGPLDELCRAADQTGDRFVPLPAFNYKGAFNFYLPIFFSRSIRIEIEAVNDISEFYTQIDYRTGEAALATRLKSENRPALKLSYSGKPPSFGSRLSKSSAFHQAAVLSYGAHPGELTIQGPAIIRELAFEGDSLDGLLLQIYWDGEPTPSVEAPLKYFFADFINSAMETRPGRSITFFSMPFRRSARVVVRSSSGEVGRVRVEYSLERGGAPENALYFHAQYRETTNTTGYSQYSVLDTHGEGLFVGMNLFDSGHNHGGGDVALIDAASEHPRVLHGICGEDYFGFAWHHFGTMTPLTGAPAHERRYRLHLENPYPFHHSIEFLFGVFAGQHPRSVAFWYQVPVAPANNDWSTFDIPWKILGPAALDTSLPSSATNDSYRTTISLNSPSEVEERWQDIGMRSSFLDATYQFRHYVMTAKGTGFVAGAGKTKIITYVYAPARRDLRALLGHDDRVTVALNDDGVVDLAARKGFDADDLKLQLHAGWNKLDLTVYNDENVNWRWCGVSLAFERQKSADLRFAAEAP